jgi:glycosyltransferase involved in cell wall biosynthesis
MGDRHRSGPLRVAMLGTRGVPARYGGFETAVEEIGRRLVERGNDVTVYCRRTEPGVPLPRHHLGMHLVELPALRVRSAETLSHSALSTMHAVARSRPDVVFVFNSANAVFLPVLRARRLPVAVHTDGLEWRRAKWSGAGKTYYRAAESLAVRWADALIADAPGIADYYREEFGATTELLTYGAPILDHAAPGRLGELELEAGRFHLVVARMEPENHVELIVRGYRRSAATHPLVIVGRAAYGNAYVTAVRAAAGEDPRVRLAGAVWDQDLLNELYSRALLYVHGHSVGGTNPSLLRAMGAGAAVAAYDVRFNRDVVGEHGRYFSDEGSVAKVIEGAEADAAGCAADGRALRSRAAEMFRWDDVTDGYEALADRLAGGWSRRGEVDGRRRSA